MSSRDSISIPPGWRTYRVSADHDHDTGVTVHELDSGVPGPVLLVLGGVHGNEIGGIVAAGRIIASTKNLLSGRLLVVPISHEAAQQANLRESVLDGGNLARSFPGSADGTATEQLASLIAERLISSADVLIDLHTSSPAADMPLFVGCLDDDSPASVRAVQLAIDFGIPTVWTHPELGPGRTLTVARDQGIPALYVESPNGGVLDKKYLDAYAQGVRSVLENLDMISDRTRRERPKLWLHGNGDIDTFMTTPSTGYFLPATQLLEWVEQGVQVGEVVDIWGGQLSEIRAPMSGYITTLQRTAIVDAGQPIIGITQQRPLLLNTRSDRIVSQLQVRSKDD